MRNDFLPFSKPSITDSDIAAVADVLRSGWITTGPKCAQLESDFKKYTGCTEAVSLPVVGSEPAMEQCGVCDLSVG